jgi:hypothetical protein
VDTPRAHAHARLDQGPLILSGVPPILSGRLELANASDEKLKLRAIQVSEHDDESARQFGLDRLVVGARLAPRQRALIQAHFLVDPFTPPGMYRASVALGEQRTAVVAHVFEKLDLRIDPARIHLRGAGGDVRSQRILITNAGNVTEALRDLALVFLEERNWVNRSLVYALRETQPGEGHQAYFDRVVTELRNTLARPARITLRGQHVNALAPGEAAEVDLEITLPAELVKGRVYIGSTPFMSGRLSFKVECNGASKSTRRRPR